VRHLARVPPYRGAYTASGIVVRMIDVLLINPPIARYDVAELAPPLGLLVLAASLRAAGRDVAILDLNLPSHREAADHQSTYFDYVANHVALFRPQEIGITSMGVNTHASLALATQLAREFTPNVIVGGVHASTVSGYLRHELPAGVRIAPSRNALAGPDWWNSSAPDYSAEDLFSQDPAQYFEANPRRLANVGTGFGCKYNCSFCYSPAEFGIWKNRYINDVVHDFSLLESMGFRHMFLIDDNLINNPDWFLELTKKIAISGTRLTWNGYATLPDLTEEIIENAASAGCINLYLGIDAVAPQQQRSWKKKFLRDHNHVFSLLSTARAAGMQLTCAFILDIHPDLDPITSSTLEFSAKIARLGGDVRLSVITPYPRTPLFAQSVAAEYSEQRTAILMDLPQIVVSNQLAKRYPALFPWHARPQELSEGIWCERLLAVHAAQVLLNTPATIIEENTLWKHCLAVARAETEVGAIHKTELKSLVREISAALAA
jgi:hypothetical protein